MSQPNPDTGMYVLKCALQPNQTRRGGIIPLSRLRGPVQLTPHFDAQADRRLTMQTSIEYSTEFLLNKYAGKEDFFALHSSAS